jgi:hypothetical protein
MGIVRDGGGLARAVDPGDEVAIRVVAVDFAGAIGIEKAGALIVGEPGDFQLALGVADGFTGRDGFAQHVAGGVIEEVGRRCRIVGVRGK